MKAKILRRRAHMKMQGKRGTLALICFVRSVLSIGGILVAGPLSLSLADVSLSVTRKQETDFNQLFMGFSRFEDSFLLGVLNMLFIYLWCLLFIVPGIIMSYAYSMAYFIMLDNPGLKPNEARKRSIALMKGHKWRLFCLNMSFLGWDILSLMTFGILYFWVTPYRQTAFAEFYEDLIGNTTSEYAETVKPDLPTPMPASEWIEPSDEQKSDGEQSAEEESSAPDESPNEGEKAERERD